MKWETLGGSETLAQESALLLMEIDFSGLCLQMIPWGDMAPAWITFSERNLWCQNTRNSSALMVRPALYTWSLRGLCKWDLFSGIQLLIPCSAFPCREEMHLWN